MFPWQFKIIVHNVKIHCLVSEYLALSVLLKLFNNQEIIQIPSKFVNLITKIKTIVIKLIWSVLIRFRNNHLIVGLLHKNTSVYVNLIGYIFLGLQSQYEINLIGIT